MQEEYKSVTTQSWFSRLRDSFKSLLFGILCFIAAIPLIWWNEDRAVNRAKALEEAQKLVVAVAADKIDPANSAKMIHISGLTRTDDILYDNLFGVRENAIKLERQVEMYQWTEHKETKESLNNSGSKTTETTYTYKKGWHDKVINSAFFKYKDGHNNPKTMPHTSATFRASRVYLEAFALYNTFIDMLDNFVPYQLSDANYAAMDNAIKGQFKLHENEYFSGDPANPNIGDLRVKFRLVKPEIVSIIGKQVEQGIDTYYVKTGEIALLELGTVSAEKMLVNAERENMIMTWLIRIGALALMWFGLAMIFSPIKTLADIIPFLGAIFQAGIIFLSGIAALIISIVNIGLAWLYYRPVVGVSIILIACVIAFVGFKKTKKNQTV